MPGLGHTFWKDSQPEAHVCLLRKKRIPKGRGVKLGPVVYSWTVFTLAWLVPLPLLIHPFAWPVFACCYYLSYTQWSKNAKQAAMRKAGVMTAMPAVESAPQNTAVGGPGWYSDPNGSGFQKYWDGQRWEDKWAPPREKTPA